jgi:hypothetical protein
LSAKISNRIEILLLHRDSQRKTISHKKPIFAKSNKIRLKIMAKGPEKNTRNKALHTKLLNRKKAKIQEEKKERALRLKALVTKMNEKKNTDEPDEK